MLMRFHTQTAGVSLTAQQPRNNIARVAIQAMAAVLGGTQSLHCNGRDEALALPTEESARIALRTQQIIAAESGVANTVDPIGGSWEIERRTTGIEDGARALLETIEQAGGTLRAVEAGLVQRQIQDAAYEAQRNIDSGASQVVGVNAYVTEDHAPIPLLELNPDVEPSQVARVRALRASRNEREWRAAIDAVAAAATSGTNLVPPVIAAVEARATLGEISDTLRGVFGEHRELLV